jgi:hypothetical protein
MKPAFWSIFAILTLVNVHHMVTSTNPEAIPMPAETVADPLAKQKLPDLYFKPNRFRPASHRRMDVASARFVTAWNKF